MQRRRSRNAARPSTLSKLTRLALVFALLSAATLAHAPSRFVEAAQAEEYDVAIINGRVIDGTGRAAFRADVGIKGDRISFVGLRRKPLSARRVIDARGLVVAPGFIDMLGQSEQN